MGHYDEQREEIRRKQNRILQAFAVKENKASLSPYGLALDSVVKTPKHYKILDTEAIDIIFKSLSQEEFGGYCLGNALKYRLRAGKKDKLEQDIAKAEEYELIYAKYYPTAEDK